MGGPYSYFWRLHSRELQVFLPRALARYKGVQLTLDKDSTSDCFSDGRHSRFKVLILGKRFGFLTVCSKRMQVWMVRIFAYWRENFSLIIKVPD